MKITKRMFGIGAMMLLAAGAMAKQAPVFGQKELEQMVSQLTQYLPEDPRLKYPIKCRVETKDDVNAYASVEVDKNAKAGEKPQAIMVVYTGLVKWMNNDLNLVRAVVCHEIAHLSKGHLGKGMKAADLDLVFTRQQEYEADATGAAVLEKAGFSRKDMVNMLLRLGEVSREAPASIKVMGDHADTQRRALNIEKNNLVLRSMVSFTNGEAYMDVRAFNQAMMEFDKAKDSAPDFYEAQYNGTLCAFLKYYDEMDATVRENWFQPDFGPSMLLPLSKGRAGIVTDGDKANYADAMVRMKALLAFDAKRQETNELFGLALVLDPNGTPANIQEGIKTLEAALGKAVLPDQRLRIANNLAIGYQRSGNVTTAVDKMFAEQKKTTRFNPYLAANLGAQALPSKFSADDAKLAANVLFTFLSNINQNAVGYARAESTFKAILSKYNLKTGEIKRQGIPLTSALSLTDGGRTIFLLRPFAEYFDQFGKADIIRAYSPTYQGILEFVWQGGNLTIVTDKTFTDEVGEPGKVTKAMIQALEVIRITSYNPGAAVTLQSADPQVKASFKFYVGMTVEDFNKIIPLSSGASKQLIHNAAMEEWTYFYGLNFGVYVKDGKVAGVTVCPVKSDD